jgi:hypothetical protein
VTLNRKVAITFVFAVLASAVLIAVAAAAFGSDVPVQRGAACTHVGQVAKNRHGVKYVCEQRPGDDCPRYHALNPQPGPWPPRSTLPCATCSPSPSPSASGSAHASPTGSKAAANPSGSPTPPPTSSTPVPVADQLPVTGVPTVVIGIATTGGLLIAAGVALVLGTIRRRNA